MNLKKFSTVSLASAALLAGIAAPANAATTTSMDPAVSDAIVSANSNTPVPGLATIGSLTVGNSNARTTGDLPVGTVFNVKFVPMDGNQETGRATLTTIQTGSLDIKRLGDNEFQVVTTRTLGAGRVQSLDWSKAHLFHPGARDRVVVSLATMPQGYTDADTSNNVAVYDNNGWGF